MAHSCPDCGQACYCGSDIDDCLFDFDEDAEACNHCLGKEETDDCMDCGMCDSCIELTKTHFDEMSAVAKKSDAGKPLQTAPPTGAQKEPE